MAQATAVHPKITIIAAIRLNMVGCVSTLSRRPFNIPRQVGHVKYFSSQSAVPTHTLLHSAPLAHATVTRHFHPTCPTILFSSAILGPVNGRRVRCVSYPLS